MTTNSTIQELAKGVLALQSMLPGRLRIEMAAEVWKLKRKVREMKQRGNVDAYLQTQEGEKHHE